jgi:hypothetical protein
MAGRTFRLEHVKQVVDQVSRKAQYPLADAAALETALGGADGHVALGAEQHKASEVHEIPADFFPIESAEDLFAKLAFLRSANGDQPEGMTPGKRQSSPPPDAGPLPTISPPTDRPTGRNVPSVKVIRAKGQ